MPTIEEIMASKGITIARQSVSKSNGSGHSAESEEPSTATPAMPTSASSFSFKRPTINKIDSKILPPEILEAARREIVEFRGEAERAFTDFVRVIFEARRTPKDDLFFYRLDGSRKAAEAEIERLINLNEPEFRNVAVAVYAHALAQTANESEVVDVFHRLVEIGFIVQTERSKNGVSIPEGQVVFMGRQYRLESPFSGKSESIATIGLLRRLSRDSYKKETEKRANDLSALEVEVAKFPIVLANLKKGDKDGRILLRIPPRVTEKKSYAGGYVAFEVRSGRIRVFGAAGGLKDSAEKIRQAGVCLYSNLIFTGNLSVIRTTQENQWMPQTLRAWLTSAIDEVERAEKQMAEKAKREAELLAEREAYAEEATITIEQFLGRGNVGTAFLDWSSLTSYSFILKTTDTDGKPTEEPIPDLFFLVKRGRNGMVSVVRCPERLEVVLGPHKNPKTPGQKYAGLGILGAILQAAYGNLVRKGLIDPNQTTRPSKRKDLPTEPEVPSVESAELTD